MSVFRVEKTKDFTIMSNYHLRDKNLSLKAKGLLSQMLSLPEEWDYTLAGLAHINKESKDAIRTTILELEKAGYITRHQTTTEGGRFGSNEYVIRERPLPHEPLTENPTTVDPQTAAPLTENPTQLNTNPSKTEKEKTELSSTDSLPISQKRNRTEVTAAEMQQYREIIAQNISYDLLRQEYPHQQAQLEEILESTGLADVRGRLINNLSKGYRQRVGIAQALVGNPEIVILDEPTVGLDPKQIIEIRDLIRMLGQKHTVILSSHILSEVSAVCDSVMIIAHGRLVANGTPEELTRLFAGEQEIHMELKGNEDAVRSALGALENAAAADIASENGVTRATLRPENGADIREAVFRACAKANLPILEMHTERASLEEIFLELTQGDGQEGAAQPPEEQNETPAEGGETA